MPWKVFDGKPAIVWPYGAQRHTRLGIGIRDRPREAEGQGRIDARGVRLALRVIHEGAHDAADAGVAGLDVRTRRYDCHEAVGQPRLHVVAANRWGGRVHAALQQQRRQVRLDHLVGAVGQLRQAERRADERILFGVRNLDTQLRHETTYSVGYLRLDTARGRPESPSARKVRQPK